MATRMRRVPAAGAIVIAVLLALLLMLSGGTSGTGSGPELAHAKCGGIKVKEIKPITKFGAPFASQYTKKMRVQIFNYTGGVHKWKVELYDFSSNKLGSSKRTSASKYLYWGDTATIKLKQPMQPNQYTLVLKGDVRGCGFSEASDTTRLRGCLKTLPIKVFDRPKGKAADYNSGGYVSVGVIPKTGWQPIRDVRSTLTSFSGVEYGRAELQKPFTKLIGKAYLDNKLTRTLVPGDYSVFITGKAPQPPSCGEKSKSITLSFE
jgi:hypothetical protein